MTATNNVAASALALNGVVGPKESLVSLEKRITRKRSKGSGSKRELAQRLFEKLKELAKRRWAVACKGQRRPTPKQALDLVKRIKEALTVQGRCKERTLEVQEVILTCRQADYSGTCTQNGGVVTANSYGYKWSTTTAYASRQTDGTIKVRIDRMGAKSVSAPAKHWKDVSASSDILRFPSAEFGIRQADDSFIVYDADCNKVGIAVPMPKELHSRFGKWEHGLDVATCQAEIEHKREIVNAEKAQAEIDAREKAKAERRAALLARIGTKTLVTYNDARACGMCDAGIMAFAAKIGITDTSASVPLAEVFKHEPAYALKLAKRILDQRKQTAA